MKSLIPFVCFFVLLIPTAFAATNTIFMESGTDATQDFSFYNATAGNITSNSVTVHTGSRSIRLNTSNPAVGATINTFDGTATDAGTRMDCWFRYDTATAVNAATFIIVQTSAGAIVTRLQLQPGGKINILGANAANGNFATSPNTWYRMTLSYTITNSTTFTIKSYINGILDATMNTGTLTNVGSTRFQFASPSAVGINSSFYYDDIYVDNGTNSSDPGDIRVTAKRPVANGTTNDFTTQIGSGGSGYGTGHSPQVNEQPLSIIDGWSKIGAGLAVTEEYNIESPQTGDTTPYNIVATAGWVYAKSLAGETGQIILNGATSNISLTSTNTLFTKFADSSIFPLGIGTDVGIVTDTSLTTVSLFEAGVLVAYKPQFNPYQMWAF